MAAKLRLSTKEAMLEAAVKGDSEGLGSYLRLPTQILRRATIGYSPKPLSAAVALVRMLACVSSLTHVLVPSR